MLILFPFIYAFPCLFFLAFTTFYFLFIQFILCFLLFLFFSIIFYCSIYAILLALSLNFFSLSTFSCTFQILFLFSLLRLFMLCQKEGPFVLNFVYVYRQEYLHKDTAPISPCHTLPVSLGFNRPWRVTVRKLRCRHRVRKSSFLW